MSAGRRIVANAAAPSFGQAASGGSGTKKARYDQPVKGTVSGNCQSGYHYNCTKLSCTCICGHGIKGWSDPATPPYPPR